MPYYRRKSVECPTAKHDAIETLMSAHYYLMANKQFWYDKSLREASKLLCVAASDLRRNL